VPLLRGDSVDWRQDFLIELPPDHNRYAFAGVRSQHWKYIVNNHKGVFEELYDLDRDPLELDNLVMTRPNDPTVARLRKQLRGRIQQFIGVDPMRPRGPQ